jgi:hypothetical protein
MQPTESFLSQLRRYFYWNWLLVTPEGDIFAQAATRRKNRQMLRRWLPHYVKVHAVLTGVWASLVWLLPVEGFSTFAAALASVLEGVTTLGLGAILAILILREATGDLDRD